MLSTSQELDLLKWIHDRNSNDLSVCHAIVSQYCRTTINTTNCTFTTGWFARFMNRHSLSRRRVTSYSHSPLLVDHANTIQEYRERYY